MLLFYKKIILWYTFLRDIMKNKNNLIKEFSQTEFGKKQMPRLKRIIIYGILLLLFSIILLIEAIIKHKDIFQYVAAAILFVFGLIFIIGERRILNNNLIDYIKNKTKKKKK